MIQPNLSAEKLSELNNLELNQKIKNLATQERHLTGLILEHIAEVDRRKLYAEMAYSSLFDYLTKEIGYSAGGAQRRIDAARLLQRIPEVLTEVANGSIQLGQISKLQQACRQVRKESGTIAPITAQKQILEKLKNKTNAQTDLILAREFHMKIAKSEARRTQRDESVRVELTFSKEEDAIVKNAQALLSHTTGGSLKDTIIEMARKLIKDSMLKGDLPPKAASTATVAVPLPKSVTPKLKKEILNRDQVCQFRDKTTGKVCGSKHFLEVDHIHPRFAGGTNASQNLRVLCRNHNMYRYRAGTF